MPCGYIISVPCHCSRTLNLPVLFISNGQVSSPQYTHAIHKYQHTYTPRTYTQHTHTLNTHTPHTYAHTQYTHHTYTKHIHTSARAHTHIHTYFKVSVLVKFYLSLPTSSPLTSITFAKVLNAESFPFQVHEFLQQITPLPFQPSSPSQFTSLSARK